MISIELTDGQGQAIRAEQGRPVAVLDPTTNGRYVLLAEEQFERVRPFLEQAPGREPGAAPAEVPAVIRRSQQAFWRDLPVLLEDGRHRGRWVCYHGEERIGIGTYEELIQECVRRGLADNEYDLEVIEPQASPPWEAEEIEGGGHEVNGVPNVDPNAAADISP
jgi:hypothetical protein